jgi:hypothetical protein
MAVILDYLAARRHRPQRHGRLDDFGDYRHRVGGSSREQRQRSSRSALIAHSASRRTRCKQDRNPSASAISTSKAAGTRARRIGIGEALDHAQAETDREAILIIGRLQRAVPARGVDADRPDLDAVIARIAHDLRRRVESHRPCVQEPAQNTSG